MDREQFKSLPEKLRRLILGQEAAEYGRGGVRATAFTFWLYIAIRICSISTNNMKNRFL